MRHTIGILAALFVCLHVSPAIARDYAAGEHVQVNAFNQWYPAVVTNVSRGNIYTIRYDGRQGDYVTLLDYMHPVSGGPWRRPPAVGDAVKVTYAGADYPAHVVAARPDRIYRVRNAAGTEWNTTADYLRPVAGAATPPAAAPAPSAGGAAPVAYTFVGIDKAANAIRYRFAVHAPKPVKEVHVAAKYVGADGKVINDTTIVWQNIVHSTRQPIENGKTYEDTSYLFPNTTRVESKLLRVIYADGTRWDAP